MSELTAAFRVKWIRRFAGSERTEVFLEALFADPGDELETEADRVLADAAFEASSPDFGLARPDKDGNSEGVILVVDADPPELGEVMELALRSRGRVAMGLIAQDGNDP